jgi:hypothetical protein
VIENCIFDALKEMLYDTLNKKDNAVCFEIAQPTLKKNVAKPPLFK